MNVFYHVSHVMSIIIHCSLYYKERRFQNYNSIIQILYQSFDNIFKNCMIKKLLKNIEIYFINTV